MGQFLKNHHFNRSKKRNGVFYRTVSMGSTMKSWRGGRDLNRTEISCPDVLLLEETSFIPSFTITWSYDWALLASGERVFDEDAARARCQSEQPEPGSAEQKFESVRLINGGTENVKKTPKIGANYLTRTGLPVRVLRLEKDQVVLRSLATDDVIVLPAVYPLETFDEGAATSAIKPAPSEPGPGSYSPDAKARKLLAPIIDTLLLNGGLTMRGIVRVLKRKASVACRGKDLKANVRARIYWLRRKGCLIDSDELGRITARSSE